MDELFENDYFTIIGSVSDKDALTDSIDECGGIYVKTLNKKTTLIICNDIDDENNKKEFEKIKNDSLKIIKESFITESIKEKKRLNVDDFITKSNSSGSTDTGNSANGDDNNDDQQPKKKLKLDLLQAGSIWMGALYYVNTDESYPFCFTIESRKDDVDGNAGESKLEGTIDWPTLDDAKTAFRATLKNDELKIEEHTQITNTDQVSLPNNYEAKVINGVKPSIKGQIVYTDPADTSNPDLKASFNLTYKSSNSLSSSTGITNNNNNTTTTSTTTTTTATTPQLDLSYLVDGNQFNGDFEIPYKFNLKVTSRKNPKDIEGIIDWVDLKTKTKFKGTLNETNNENSIQLTEYEIISGDQIEVPISYIGKLISTSNPSSIDPKDLDTMIGTYKVDGTTNSTGKFKLELINN